MNTDNNKDFDFDDWAGLYKENPEEFEARRQALLMIELARVEPSKSQAARSLIDEYERRVDGANAAKRMTEAARMMNESLQQLQTELLVLRQALMDEAGVSETQKNESIDALNSQLANNVFPFKVSE